jgi:hypothetical protein
MSDKQETPKESPKFDFAAYPEDTLIHDRRTGNDRRHPTDALTPEPSPEKPGPAVDRRQRKERRRRIDPTTFEKQYTEDELEFMNAMQAFKVQTGRVFPSHGEVIRVAMSLGYRKILGDEAQSDPEIELATDGDYDPI